MSNDTIIKIPVVDQLKDTSDDYWKDKTCGICSLKMLLSFCDIKNKDIFVMDLVGQGLELNAYLEGVGWKHSGLVEIARRYGVNMDFQKIFPKTSDERKKVLNLIDSNLNNGKPVIVSVFWGFNPENGGHLVVVNGFKKKGRKIAGYNIQDPDHRFRGNTYFISREEFISGWRGGVIWLVD